MTAVSLLVMIAFYLPAPSTACLSVSVKGVDRSVSICISQSTGEIETIAGQVGDRSFSHSVSGSTRLDGCRTNENMVLIDQHPLGAISVNRTVTCHPNYWHHEDNLTATINEMFTPSPESVSIGWKAVVQSSEIAYWTTSIDTSLIWHDYTNSLFWTGGPLTEIPVNQSYSPLDPIMLPTKTDTDTFFRYGGGKTDIRDPKVLVAPSLVIPAATRIDPHVDTGVSLLFSPEDTPVYSLLNAYSIGAHQEMAVFNYSRQYSRLGNKSREVAFSQDIVAHEGCWRAPLAWMREQYKSYFYPDSRVDIYSLDGPGAYADYTGFKLDSVKLKAMDFTVNWDATFPYPYHGMWLPYPPFYSSPWLTCFPHHLSNGTSEPCINLTYSDVDSNYQMLKSAGFHSLAYANLFEYGLNIVELNATLDCPANATNQTKITCDSNRFLRETFSSAILRDRRSDKMIYGGDGKSIIMDPGTDVYQNHILNMAKTVLTKTSCAGIAIDRQDWIGYVNPHRDDERTWLSTPDTKGFPVQAMIFSWKDAMASLSELMHGAKRAVFINDHTYRLDMMQHVDGFYDEFGDNNAKMMATSLLSIGGKTAVAWNHKTTTDLDTYLQRHLFWGIYPTVPFPLNDHCINPSPTVDSLFEDYGPLFAALRGKRWVLDSHAVMVTNRSAQANVFQIKSRFVVSVVFGLSKTANVEVELNLKGVRTLPSNVKVMYPGFKGQHEIGNVRFSRETVTVSLQLQRGCALLLVD